MDKECEYCRSKALEFVEIEGRDLCLFCFQHPVPDVAGEVEQTLWRVGGAVANYVERRLVKRIHNAVEHALQRVKDNDL